VGGVNARRTPEATRGQGVAPRRLVSLATAAAYADVSTRTLRRYIAQGRLTGYRVGPRLVKVDLNELQNLASPIPSAVVAAERRLARDVERVSNSFVPS
jgi:excisionase family DNA binding protein